MNKLTAYLFIFFVLVFSGLSFGQHLPLYSQYFIDPLLYNPAATGYENFGKIFLLRRDQWTSINGSPVNNTASFDSPVKDKIGLGISFHNEIQGINTRNSAYGYYSYKLKLSDQGKLVFGLSLGVVSNAFNFSKVVVLDQNDPYLLSAPQSNTFLDSKAGVFLKLKKLELGLSAIQLTGNSFQKSGYLTQDNMNQTFYISSKYTFVLNAEKNIICYPYLLAKTTSGNLFQYDLNFVVDWKNKAWAAASYRSSYAVGLSAGVVLLKKLRIGYAYDLITNPLKSYSGLSHEILLGYAFPDAKTREYKKEIRTISKKLKKRGDSILQQLSKCYEQKEHTINKEELQKIDDEIEKYKKELDKMKDTIEKKPSE